MENMAQSRNFSTVLVRDPRLNVTDKIKYGVISGASSVTSTQFTAISQSPSQIVFNIQVPSEATILDRHILLTSQITLNMTATITAAQLALIPAANRAATNCI